MHGHTNVKLVEGSGHIYSGGRVGGARKKDKNLLFFLSRQWTMFEESSLIILLTGLHVLSKSTRVVPKLMPPIYFHGNYTRYKEHNNTIW